MKENRIVHLQIQESQLMKYGKVNQATTRWVPISKFTILDKGVKDGIDYHMLEFDQREMDLDDLTAPVGHVVVSIEKDWLELSMNNIFSDWRSTSSFGSSFESCRASF